MLTQYRGDGIVSTQPLSRLSSSDFEKNWRMSQMHPSCYVELRMDISSRWIIQDPTHFMFGSRVGLSGLADRMALFPVLPNPRWRPWHDMSPWQNFDAASSNATTYMTGAIIYKGQSNDDFTFTKVGGTKAARKLRVGGVSSSTLN